MKSRITIDFDYEKSEPVIKVQLIKSEDVRDGMLQNFFDKLQTDILKVELVKHEFEKEKIYHIKP